MFPHRSGPGSRLLLCALPAVLVLFGAGCPNKVPTYATRGKVVYKGGQPLRNSGLNVWFESTTPPYHRSSAKLDENGEFVLSFSREGDGAPEGEHRISFAPGPENTRPIAESLGKFMPTRYHEFQTSGLKQTIVRGDNNLVIEVDRPSR